jgi:hypothetical protein
MSRGSLLLALTLALAACGGTAEEADVADSVTPSQTEAPSQPEPTTTEASSDDGSSDGGGGADLLIVPAGDSTVSVDGKAMTTQELLRCIPFDESDGTLDLQVFGDGFQLNVYITTGGAPFMELSISGRAVGDGESTGVFSAMVSELGGTWYLDAEEPVDGPPFDWQGDRIRGSLTLADIFEEADPIEVDFDVIVPGDVNDCSL